MNKRGQFIVLLAMALTLWVGRYAQSAQFGLYEDDYTRTPKALVMSGQELVQQAASSFRTLSDHGKPLHSPIIYSLSFLGGKLNGLQGIYWLGYAICLLNAWLFYCLMLRLGSAPFALIGGLTYCLFSADTTQAFLTHALGLQPSMTFLLLAFHSYLGGRRWLAYLLGGLILLNYETPFPLLAAAPLLKEFQPDRESSRKWKEWVGHLLILGGMALAVALLRRLAGESRISQLDVETILRVPLTQMGLGVFTSLKLFLYTNPKMAFINLDLETVKLSTAVMAGVFFLILWWGSKEKSKTNSQEGELKSEDLTFKKEVQRILIGIVLLALAYPLSFTVSASASDGRDSRVHLAAVVGVSWLVAGGASLLFRLIRAYGQKYGGFLRAAVTVGLAGFFALQVGFGALIQRDYVNSWQYQRLFWRQLLPLISDADDGDIILVEPSVMRSTGQIGVITWNTPFVLEKIYHFPEDWDSAPKVYRLEPGWENAILSDEGLFQINQHTSFIPDSLYVDVASTDVIFIENQAAGLVRHTQPLMINGVEYPVKQPEKDNTNLFIPAELYDLMILTP